MFLVGVVGLVVYFYFIFFVGARVMLGREGLIP